MGTGRLTLSLVFCLKMTTFLSIVPKPDRTRSEENSVCYSQSKGFTLWPEICQLTGKRRMANKILLKPPTLYILMSTSVLLMGLT
jgi:hypothetical protein